MIASYITSTVKKDRSKGGRKVKKRKRERRELATIHNFYDPFSPDRPYLLKSPQPHRTAPATGDQVFEMLFLIMCA